jgi:ankyrin repeat protein
MNLDTDDSLAKAVGETIRGGDAAALQRLLDDHPGLAAARVGPRTLLHLATDWPGKIPNGVAIVTTLIAAGAEVNARFTGRHAETPLHWAASNDDVAVIDALLDAGADIEAPGAVIGGGTPLADAVAFGQWQAARRLLERGARPTLWQAAALGLIDRVAEHFTGDTPPPKGDIDNAFWCACHGGQRATAEYLLDRSADLNWVGHDGLTPLDAALRSRAEKLADWLSGRGAKAAKDLERSGPSNATT